MEEESLVNSDDDDIPIQAAASTYKRRDLHKNKGFYGNILPVYTIDEFKSHFRFEGLLNSVPRSTNHRKNSSTTRVWKAPIPLDKQVLAFVWFIANSEEIRSVAEGVAAMIWSLAAWNWKVLFVQKKLP